MSLIHKPRFDDIKEMFIADGLKELLIEYGFNVERLIRLSTSVWLVFYELMNMWLKSYALLQRSRSIREKWESLATRDEQ
jgi:hypothetical protein